MLTYTNKKLSKKNLYWNKKNLNFLLSDLKDYKFLNKNWILGKTVYLEEEEKKKLTIKFSLKKDNQQFIMRSYLKPNYAFYDMDLEDVYIKQIIKYYFNQKFKTPLLNPILLETMFHYKSISPINSKQRHFFKLIGIQRMYDKLKKRRIVLLNNTIKAKKKEINFSETFLNIFYKKFKKLIVWNFLSKANFYNKILFGFILNVKRFKGLVISINNLYIFFMPISHFKLKQMPQRYIYFQTIAGLVGQIVEFKILNFTPLNNKLPILSRKNIKKVGMH